MWHNKGKVIAKKAGWNNRHKDLVFFYDYCGNVEVKTKN